MKRIAVLIAFAAVVTMISTGCPRIKPVQRFAPAAVEQMAK